jgi:serine/threonine protein kinase
VPTDLWQQVQEVFERVSAAPPDSRAALLDEACGADAALRGEVESLLKHDSGAEDSFLSPPCAAIRRPPSEPEGWAAALAGQKMGRYELVRLLAVGGMGCVYEARQERPARSVALKILRPGFSAPSALARFRLEPELLGRLQHPNIAQVYEAGVHVDREGILGPAALEGEGWGEGLAQPIPYFAMELIPDAQPLAEYADAQQLTTRNRLALFTKVCDAVHHGHQKGIIHRDLKPGNILVGRDGEPKVIDFGVARATDGDIVLTTQYTHVGDLIGTLHYMSPEQCDGDPAAIDTRTDIYSLGVVLYELLTGAPPYETSGTTVYAAVRMIKDELPRRPSTIIRGDGRPGWRGRLAGWRGHLARELRGDIDAILLKALEKDPARRYASAADLSQDIRCHLAREPIAARPPTVFTRAVRWALRHPVWATTGACAAVVVATGVIATTTIWLLGLRPDHAVVSKNGDDVQLLTIWEHPIKRWRSSVPAFSVPHLVTRPAELGGGRLLLFGSQSLDGNPNPPGLLVYEADGDLKEPLWIRQLEPNDIPPALTRRTDYPFGPQDFWPSKILVADLFPDQPPGLANVPEIVGVYDHRSTTHTAIRVHSLAGDVLYQVWLDVSIEYILWLPRARLLVLAGLNGEEFLEQRGVFGTGTPSHPTVVFAITPQLGKPLREYIPQEEAERARAEGPLRCAWYYCVAPHPGLL